MGEGRAFGRTVPGKGWKTRSGGGNGIYIDVDTSEGEFDADPIYIITIGGRTEQWDLLGTSTIYNPGRRSFQVIVRRYDNAELTPEDASNNGPATSSVFAG